MKPKIKVYNPQSLTPKALAFAEGRYAIGMTEADWQSLYDYWDRMELLKPVWEWLDQQNISFTESNQNNLHDTTRNTSPESSAFKASGGNASILTRYLHPIKTT